MKGFSIFKGICGAALLLTPFVSSFARQLDPEEALQRVFSSSTQKRVAGNRQLTLSYTESLGNRDYAYVFNNADTGFIVVSADDRMTPLLGYSDQGTFNPATASPALLWWLSQYAEEASAGLSSDESSESPYSPITRAESDRSEIPVMIQTKWGQENPFNQNCPLIGDKHCVTGCVATAMAQVIKYYNYPETGSGYHFYGNNSFDFENTTFRYDLMKDVYFAMASKDSKEAVAQLMLACGIAVNMNYSLTASGAPSGYIASALRKFFKYDNGVRFYMREYFTTSQWEEIVYNELKEGRPVLYGGQAPQGGHQFVCDGYDGNGLFHINWGWSGTGDGYFKLNSLDPHYQGTGGFEGGYNSDQSIVCGIQPPVEGSKIYYPIFCSTGLTVTAVNKETVVLAYSNGGLVNYSQDTFDVELLIQATDANGKVYISEPCPYVMDNGEVRTFFRFIGGTASSYYIQRPTNFFMPKGLSSGEYRCTLVVKTPEGNIQPVLYPATAAAYFNVSIAKNGTVSFTQGIPEANASIKVVKFEPIGAVVQNEKASFSLTVENSGEEPYAGEIMYKIFKDGTQVEDTDCYITFNSIQPGESPTFSYDHTFDLEPGVYNFIFYSMTGQQISNPFPISIGSSGVDAIVSSSAIDIFAPNGTLLLKGVDPSVISTLQKGIYILKDGSKTYKIAR